jgi:hypothetical protein
MTDTKIQEFSIDSQILELTGFKVPVVCLVTGCVSRRRDARYFYRLELLLSPSCETLCIELSHEMELVL